MKKRLLAILAVSTIGLTGCGSNEALIAERDALTLEIQELKTERDELKDYVVDQKVKKGLEKYVLTIKIGQRHMIWDIEENIKDAINDIKIEIPVDKEFYDSVEAGDVLDNSFRTGSFLIHGSLGSWDIVVEDKEVR